MVMSVFKKLVLVLVTVLCLVGYTHGQDCVPPCELSLSSCNYVDYDIYTVGLDVTANEQTAALGLSFTGFITDADCIDVFKRFLCGDLFPACSNSTGVLLPAKPCLSICEEFHAKCAAYVGFLGFMPEYLALVQCDRVDADGSPHFDNSSSCYTLTNTVPVCEPTNGGYPGGCTPYTEEEAPITYDMCAPFVDKQVYVANKGSPLSSMDVILNSTMMWQIEKVYPLMSFNCYHALVGLLCQGYFPSCRTLNVTGELIEVREPLCSSMCDHTNEVCSAFFIAAGQPLLDCTMMAPLIPGVRQWPDGPIYTVTQSPGYQNDTLQVLCSTSYVPSNAVAPYSQKEITKCPFVTEKRSNPGPDEAVCWLACPEPMYTEQEWDALVIVGQFFASFSFIAAVYSILSYAVDPLKRRFPTNLHIFLFISIIIFVIGFFINGQNPGENVWCKDKATFNTARTSAACAAQGFFIIYGSLSVLAWWVVIAFTCFAVVVLELKTDSLVKYKLAFHFWSWIIPGVFVAAAFGTDSVRYQYPLSWCFVHPANEGGFAEQTMDGAWSEDFALYYIPIAVCIGLACAMLLAVLYKVISVTAKVKNTQTDKSKTAVRAQRRIVLFVVILGIQFVFLLGWRISLTEEYMRDLKEKDSAWFACKMKQEFGFPDPGHCPEDFWPVVINYGINFFETMIVSSFGIAAAACFGVGSGSWTLWKKIFKLAKNKQWTALQILIVKGKSVSDESGTASTTTNSSTRKGTTSSSPSSSGMTSSSNIATNSSVNSSSEEESKIEVKEF